MLDELRQIIVCGAVFPIAALAFHLADLLGVILVVLPEHGKERLVVLSHALKGVANLFGGNIIVLVANFLICFCDTETDFVKHTVGFLRGEALAGHLARLHVP